MNSTHTTYSWEPFGSYQLSSTADLANLDQVEVNGLDWQCCLAGSSKTAPQDLNFFHCHGCRLFILCEIHRYFCPHIFWLCYFSLSQYVLRAPPLGFTEIPAALSIDCFRGLSKEKKIKFSFCL